MTTFSLNDFVRNVQKSVDTIDPDKLTREVLIALSSASHSDQDAARWLTMRKYVQFVLGDMRRFPTPLPANPTTIAPASSPTISPGGQATPDTQLASAAGSSANSVTSWKTRMSQERWWHPELDKPYWPGEGTGRTLFGDMDAVNLNKLAGYHDKLAVANKRVAEDARGWAGLLLNHDVKTVRDLPQAVFLAHLDKEEAA